MMRTWPDKPKANNFKDGQVIADETDSDAEPQKSEINVIPAAKTFCFHCVCLCGEIRMRIINLIPARSAHHGGGYCFFSVSH
jgi:hypothetical protein